jgi:hypothetical protein
MKMKAKVPAVHAGRWIWKGKAGDEVEVPEEHADNLIELGYFEPIKESKKKEVEQPDVSPMETEEADEEVEDG